MKKVYIAYEKPGLATCTEALQALIDRCAEEGGGQVRLTAGVYPSGTLYLKSGVELYLDAGAVLRGSSDPRDYSNRCPQPTMVEGVPQWYNALITAVDAENIAISGEGVIDGVDCYDEGGEQRFRGPHAVFFYNCRGIRVRGVTILRAACYSLMLERCEDIRVERVNIHGGQDGLRLGVCRGVDIIGCDIRSGDDCIGGSGNADVRVYGCSLNTPAGSTLMFSCVNLHVKDCVFWSPGVYPALFKDEKRYSLCHMAICAGMNYGYPQTEPSDNWLFEDVVFENAETLFRYEHDLFDRQSIPVKNITFERVVAKNLVFPSLIRGGDGIPMRMTFRDCRFECAADDSRCEGLFLRGDNFESVRMENTVLCGYGEHPFELTGVGEVSLENVRLETRLTGESLAGCGIGKTSVKGDPKATLLRREVLPGETSVLIPRVADESFRGPLNYQPKP